LTCVKIFLAQLSNKIAGLDLAPFSEKVGKHWSIKVSLLWLSKKLGKLSISNIGP